MRAAHRRTMTRSAARSIAVFAALAAAAAGSTAAAPDILPDFVEIPAGPFVMGADPARDADAFSNERWSDATGQGTVDLPTFYIARHEITVAQFAAFAGESQWKVDQRAISGQPTHPAPFVSWPDALAYCRWLEARLKNDSSAPRRLHELVRTGWRVTLPDEAQWEKAARGTDGRKYPWGDAPRLDRANFERTRTMPVGSFACPECPYGLKDMSGNVWEWTRSPNRPYPFNPSNDQIDLGADALWVMRGGHYGDPARLVRTTTRGAADPGARRPFIGFRVVLSPPHAPPSSFRRESQDHPARELRGDRPRG